MAYSVGTDRNHIEPHRNLIRIRQERECRPPQPATLPGSHCLFCAPVRIMHTRLHLNKHQSRPIAGDDVHLPAAPTPVASDHTHPLRLQMTTGDLLRSLPVHLDLIIAWIGRWCSPVRILQIMRMLIRGPAVIQRPEDRAVSRADVVIEGRRFEAVVTHGSVDGSFDRVVDGEGCLLVPGLVNAHTHLAMTLFRGLAPDQSLDRWLRDHIWPREKKLTPKDVYWGTLLGLAEMIRGGTTAFIDMYFSMDSVARAVEEVGARALLSYGIIAPTLEQIDPEIEEAERLVREWDGRAEGRIRIGLAPHAPTTCHPEAWHRIAHLARELRVPIHTHLAETVGEVEQIRAERKKSPVEWLEELEAFSVPVVAAHCVHVSEKDIEILAAHGATAVHCPTSNLKLACGIAPIQEMLDGGVSVALGTDGAASAGDLNMVEEMRLAALLAKGRTRDPEALPAAQALRCATTRGAAALGLAKELGTIEPGRRADGVLISMKGPHFCPGYDPLADLVYAGQGLDVEAVFVDGQLLLAHGEFLTLDVDEVQGRCRQLSRRFR